MPDYLCLYFGDSHECQLCGGWKPSFAEWRNRLPWHVALLCSSRDTDRYCSRECYEAAVILGWAK